MTIYKKHPDGSMDLEVNCSTDGIEACILNGLYVQDNDTIYVNVTCTDICYYDMLAYWSASTPLVPENPLVLNFEESAYAKLFVIDFTKFEYSQVQVILQAETFLTASSPIHMVANFGRKTPTL